MEHQVFCNYCHEMTLQVARFSLDRYVVYKCSTCGCRNSVQRTVAVTDLLTRINESTR